MLVSSLVGSGHRLRTGGRVLDRAGLARAHGVTTTPVVLVVERSSGTVLEGFDEGPDPAKVRTAPPTEKAKLHGRKKKSLDQEPILSSRPLTEEAFDNMVPVRGKRALGAVALPLAVAATAMGLFNRAQMGHHLQDVESL